VTDVVSAQRAAAEIGYPVALKLQAPELAHKTDAGALALAIADDAQLATAWNAFTRTSPKRAPTSAFGARWSRRWRNRDRVYRRRTTRSGVGTTLIGGLGGIWAETLDDTVLIPTDAGEETIVAALQRLRAAPIFAGTRGAPPLDIRSAARVLATLAESSTRRPQSARSR